MIKIRSDSPEMTASLAEAIGKLIPPGTVLALSGDLGAGKTVFAQGLARGLGVKERVKSPTFIIMEYYSEGRLPFYHIDAYRLAEGELSDIGFEECFDGRSVVLIEWAENISKLIPEEALRINLIRGYDEDNEWREIIFEVNKGDRIWLEEAMADVYFSDRYF